MNSTQTHDPASLSRDGKLNTEREELIEGPPTGAS